MSNPIRHIRESLSLRLSFSILGFTVGVFVISIGFLFYKSRAAVRQSAFAQATKELDNTALQISGILQEVETATNNTDWQVLEHLQPDSAYALSIRILELNPNLNGCSIAFEPSFFEEQGKYFSAYSGNNEGHIETEQEGNEEYNYFEMAWYKEPKQKKRACWIDPFHDYDSSNDEFEKDMIASYSKPLITADGRFVGVISSDLSQKRLSTILRHENFYPNAYSILTGTSGRIIAAGKDNPSLDDLERKDCIVLHKELGNTGWMLYIICPEGDIFKGYNQLIYIIISIILFGLLLMLISCYVIVSHAVDPIHLLAKQTDDMANRKFNAYRLHWQIAKQLWGDARVNCWICGRTEASESRNGTSQPRPSCSPTASRRSRPQQDGIHTRYLPSDSHPTEYYQRICPSVTRLISLYGQAGD